MKLILFLLPLFSYAYTPTPESFFRNSSNRDIEKNTVVLHIEVSSKNISETEEKEEAQKPLQYKFVFNRKDQHPTKLLQLNYAFDGAEYKIVSYDYFSRFGVNLFSSPEASSHKGLFYGLIYSLLVNDSDFMVKLFKKYDSPLTANKEVFFKKQKQLLERYQHFLSLKKEGDLSEEELPPSPLDPPTEETNEENPKDILNKPFYTDTGVVKREKDSEGIAMVLTLPYLTAKMSNKDHKLFYMNSDFGYGKNEFHLRRYSLLNGRHTFPKQIHFSFGDQEWEIKVLRLSHQNWGEDSMWKKINSLKKALAGKVIEPAPKAPFIL